MIPMILMNLSTKMLTWSYRSPIKQDDVKEINELFYDAKASAKILQEQEAKFMK